MKVLTVVGARPQFIKAFALSPRLRQKAREVLVHTGQHYDMRLSEMFFRELNLPRPDYELGVGSGSPGKQTGRMMELLDPIISREMPDGVVVYGDTNSTLAGALAAAKLHVPVAHVEAGLRSFNRTMPEEINRILTDHLAERLYCPTPQAVQNLRQEGITDGVLLTGDVMDVALQKIPPSFKALEALQISPGQYYVATVHRQENTDNPARLRRIIAAFEALPHPVIFPLHPRTRDRLAAEQIHVSTKSMLRLVDPLGYQDMMGLVRQSRGVLTDSGGLQREACALGVACFVLRDESEWVELIEEGRALLVGTDPARIVQRVIQGMPAVPRTEMGLSPVDAIVDDLLAVWGRHEQF